MRKNGWAIIFLILGTMLAPLTSSEKGQRAPKEVWAARYNGAGNGDDGGRAVAVDGAGNVIVTGWITISDEADDSDWATIKYDAAGTLLWTARYDGPGHREDRAWAVAVDASQNIIVVGSGEVADDVADYVILKYDPTGRPLWTARYDGPSHGNDEARAVAVDGSGNVYVTGRSEGQRTGNDFATVKYNAQGRRLWVKRYNGPANDGDGAVAVALDRSGNAYVTGYSYSSKSGNDCLTIKYNSKGRQLWAKTYREVGLIDEQPRSLAVDVAGNVYVAGESYSSQGSRTFAVKYNKNGGQVWLKTDSGAILTLDKAGNIYLVGRSPVVNSVYDFVTFKYSAKGALIWKNKYKLPRFGYPKGLAVDGSGNAYVYGQSSLPAFPYDDGDYTTLKYNAAGKLQWVKRYNGPGQGVDNPNAIAIDGSGGVYITGESAGAGTGQDIATVKY